MSSTPSSTTVSPWSSTFYPSTTPEPDRDFRMFGGLSWYYFVPGVILTVFIIICSFGMRYHRHKQITRLMAAQQQQGAPGVAPNVYHNSAYVGGSNTGMAPMAGPPPGFGTQYSAPVNSNPGVNYPRQAPLTAPSADNQSAFTYNMAAPPSYTEATK